MYPWGGSRGVLSLPPQRMYGFGICFGIGLLLSIMSSFFVMRPTKFAVLYTFGNIVSIMRWASHVPVACAADHVFFTPSFFCLAQSAVLRSLWARCASSRTCSPTGASSRP